MCIASMGFAIPTQSKHIHHSKYNFWLKSLTASSAFSLNCFPKIPFLDHFQFPSIRCQISETVRAEWHGLDGRLQKKCPRMSELQNNSTIFDWFSKTICRLLLKSNGPNSTFMTFCQLLKPGGSSPQYHKSVEHYQLWKSSFFWISTQKTPCVQWTIYIFLKNHHGNRGTTNLQWCTTDWAKDFICGFECLK